MRRKIVHPSLAVTIIQGDPLAAIIGVSVDVGLRPGWGGSRERDHCGTVSWPAISDGDLKE
jgi:hypothetical protein